MRRNCPSFIDYPKSELHNDMFELTGKTAVITGASRVEQLRDNLKAIEFTDAFTPELMEKIDAIVG